MSDTIEIQDAPVPEPTEDEFLVDIVDQVAPEPEAVPEPNADLVAAQARIAELEARPQTAPMDALAKQIAELAKPAEPKPQAPQMDFEGMIKNFNEKFYSNPGEEVVGLINPLFTQMQQQNAAVNAEKDIQISKLQLHIDGGQKDLYTKYSDEVEAVVKTLPPSSSVYQQAIDTVRKNHFDDILAEKAASMAEEIVAKALAEKGVGTFTNATSVQSVPPKREANKITITKSDYSKVARWAEIKGFPMDTQEDQAWAIDYYRTKGGI